MLVAPSRTHPSRPGLRGSAGIVVAVMALGHAAAWAEEAIEGRYLQNRPCRGDNSDPANLKVAITPQNITYSGGTCAIKSRRSDGTKIIFAVSCRFRGGGTMGSDIAFTPGQGGTWHMTEREGTFEADIHRCPD
ncbi:hypothetical protein [Methylobacterium sp. WSM2598]|uniref:hypothetical protein n=1 Tax=Methylobacterium sp. WSM2598 TaxID=398261 RepID=UPI001F40F827|nr:hypothetical protein [Methylobacterium sp. WSM2598]